MRTKWMHRVRAMHTWLSVFFSPLLLLFVLTGWWQTFATDETRDKGFLNSTMSKISTIHTDDYYPKSGSPHQSSEVFKILVAGMAIALTLTILLGLTLAFQKSNRAWWTATAFFFGILVPVLILYFN